MNNLELLRKIKIDCWLVLGEVWLPEERKEISFILQIAAEHGYVTPELLSKELLGDGRNKIAKRLLMQCKRLEVLQGESHEKYRLTDKGQEALDGLLLIPSDQNSEWLIWTTNEELVPQKILMVEKFRKNGSGDKNNRATKNLPSILADVQDRTLSIPFGQILDCRLKNLQGKCILYKEYAGERGTLGILADDKRVELFLKFRTWRERIELLNTEKNILIDELMQSSSYAEQWNREYQLLFTSFDDTSNSERVQFVRHLSINRPTHPKYGQFEPTKIDIGIYPESQEDVNKWADWMLSQNITDFAFDDKYQEWIKESAKSFPLHTPVFKPIFEKRSDFIDENGQRSKEYWYLSAVQDWNI